MRISACLTQAQLAAKIGVTQARISQIESGNGDIGVRLLAAISETCGFRLRLQLVNPDESESGAVFLTPHPDRFP